MDAHIFSQPMWLQVWVVILMAVNTASILFVWKRIEPRFVLLAWVINIPLINFLFYQFGYTRILGLAHVVVWTPLLIYLWMLRDKWDISGSLTGKWLAVLFTVNAVSLVIDYVDVARYLTGDRGVVEGTTPVANEA